MRLTRRNPSGRRSGKVLVFFVLLLPILLGMLGLVLDGGMMMATHRQAQNAADAAAMACAWDVLRNPSETTGNLQTIANTFAKTNNGLSTATVTPHWPPSGASAYSGNNQFVEVVVSLPVTTLFAQALSGVSGSQTVQARAVAGYEAVSAGEGVAVLDPTAKPGMSVTGGGALKVNGRMIDNSQGGGVDENNNPVNNGSNGVAASANNNSTFKAQIIEVVGGVDNPANFLNITTGGPNPLHTKQPPSPDPLIQLPTPMTSNGVLVQYPKYNNGNGNWSYAGSPQNISMGNGDTVTFPPGIYSSIKITGGSATFSPGIFVISPQQNTTNTLEITGGTVTGTGVMFYNTGNDYNPTTGSPDSGDPANYNPGPSGNNAPDYGSAPLKNTNFGSINIASAAVTLSPINTSGNVFKGMLFYQRRANSSVASITSNGSLSLTGTLYDKWGLFKISGGGTYNAQFVAGSIAVSGQADLTINYSGGNLGRANQVYLVE
jgi:Flp pilus assembly protein TadG